MSFQSVEKNPVLDIATESHQQSVNSLPSEILEYIFSLASSRDTLSQYIIRFNISWVCQLWRCLITNNVSLWTSINFSSNVELVATVVRRSREAKLQVELWYEAFDDPEKLKLLKSILISEANRIETIQAILSSLKLQLIVDDVLCRPFPSLRELVFSGDPHDEIPLINFQIPFTLDINKLEVFEIHNCSQIPWDCLRSVISKVRKIDIYFGWKETCLDFFTDTRLSFTQLEVLSMQFESICDLHELQFPVIIFPNVKTLITEGRSFSLLANRIRIPHLQYLTIYDDGRYHFTYHPDFDYSSIQYLSVALHYAAPFFLFQIMGSTAKDIMPPRSSGGEEFLISNSSPVKRFHLRAYFRGEIIGYYSSLRVLDDLLPNMPGVRELSLPYMIPNHTPTMRNPLPSDIITRHKLLASLKLIRSSSNAQVFGR